MKRETTKRVIRARPRRFADLGPAASFPSADYERPTRGTILHPSDYSASSRQAFELACRIARDRGSRLIVMHVAEPVRISSSGMAPVPSLPKGYRGAWESRLRLLRPADANVQVEYRVEEGDVASAILRVASEAHCDLIVMAGRARAWLRRLLKESVSEEVERKARCPVLRLNTNAADDSSKRQGMKPRPILYPTDLSRAGLPWIRGGSLTGAGIGQ